MAAYVSTNWQNTPSTATPLSAANLNKLTDELESQAAAISEIHQLPTWANGAAPPLTDATPLNEIERVCQVVATSQGLSYTRTTWESGWTPARNAARLNKLEQQAQANRAAIDLVTGDWFPSTWLSGPSDDAIFRAAMPPRQGSLVGIWDSGFSGIDRILARETQLGRRFDFGAASYYGGTPNSDGKATLIRNDGRHVLLDAGHYGAGNAEAILNGSRDSYITSWVQAASNCNPGGPVFVRHFHEYAGPWMAVYYYTSGVRCTSVQWRDMNRRPVDIANSLGIRNIVWIWCATIYDDRAAVFASYPGDAYVDIVGDDNYGYADEQWSGDVIKWVEHWEVHNYPRRYPVGDPRREQFKMLHDAFPDKPFGVMETGRAPHSTDTDRKRQWLARMPIDAPTYLERMIFHTYSDYGLEADANGREWTLDIPTSALQGYRDAIHHPYFKTRAGVDL